MFGWLRKKTLKKEGTMLQEDIIADPNINAKEIIDAPIEKKSLPVSKLLLKDIEDAITKPIIEKIEMHDKETIQQLQNLSESSSQVLKNLEHMMKIIPDETKETLVAISNMGEGHQKFINLLLNQQNQEDMMTYQEIAEKMVVNQTTVRGYISDLKKVGYTFNERKIGRKTVIGLSDKLLEQLLGKKPAI